jgi:hypothetical protein
VTFNGPENTAAVSVFPLIVFLCAFSKKLDTTEKWSQI